MGFNGWRASGLPPVILKAMIWPWWLMGRWNLKPKNQTREVQPSRWVSPWNSVFRLIRGL